MGTVWPVRPVKSVWGVTVAEVVPVSFATSVVPPTSRESVYTASIAETVEIVANVVSAWPCVDGMSGFDVVMNSW